MDNQNKLEFTVNGKLVSVDVDPGEMLATVLREKLSLTGTKIGCNEAECGACTVLLDGKPILSCTFPALRAQGCEVLTIEGLAPVEDGEKKLHPLQQAFVDYGAVQCGFCSPGQIMTAYALLQENPKPTTEDIRRELKDTLCRCAGYPTIEKAILAAGKSLETGEDVEPPVIPVSKHSGSSVGRLFPRPEAVEKVTGSALFTDDVKFEGMLYARVKRSGVPHGILSKLNVEEARNLPGVQAVLTAEDVPGENIHGLVIHDWPVLVALGEKTRYVGDAVAIVAADTADIAEQALRLIETEFNELPVITDPVRALEPDAVKIHEKGNLLKHIKVRKGNIEEGFSISDVIMEHTFHTATTDHAFLEPECSIARPLPDGRMEVYVGSQIPYEDREQIARALGWEEERIRVRGMLIGGGFGGKEDIAGQIHAALLANHTGKPVKLLYDRHESLIAHPKRHATQIRVKIGAMKDGTLVAVQTELYGDTGAYASLGEYVMTRATTHSAGPYVIPHVKADCYAMYTNNPPSGAYRGFGVTQSAFAVETMMDMLAEKLGVDPVELRRKNALQVGSVTNTGQVLKDSVGLLECIDKTEQEIYRLSGENPFRSRSVPGEEYKKRAWGFASAYKNTGLGGGAPDHAGAIVELFPNGKFEVRTSSADLGQGLVTVLQLIVSEELQVPVDQVQVLLSDTDLTPDGGPTTASRQTFVSGNAGRMASKAMKEAISSTIAEKYDVPPAEVRFENGFVKFGDCAISMSEVYAAMKAEGKEPKVLYDYWAPETKPLGEGGDMHFGFSFASQAAEVEVNTLTGEVQVLRVIAATDVGTALNPLGLQGQVEGGVVMGIGNALTEKFIVEDGMVITDRLARYRIPSIAQTPEIISIIVEDPIAEGPFGAKGVGEIISIPTTPAITNAIYNAVGVRVDRLPVDQELIVTELYDLKE